VGLRLEQVYPFHREQFPGYRPSGYGTHEPSGADQPFNNEDKAETLTFVRSFHPNDPTLRKLSQAKLLEFSNPVVMDLKAEDLVNNRCFHTLRPLFTHDLCILLSPDFLSDQLSSERFLFTQIQQIAGPLVLKIEELSELRGMCPTSGKHSRIYRLSWQGWVLPLGRMMCNQFQAQLRAQLVKAFKEDGSGCELAE